MTATPTPSPLASAAITWRIKIGAGIPARAALSAVVGGQLRCGGAVASNYSIARVALVAVRDNTLGSEIYLDSTAGANTWATCDVTYGSNAPALNAGAGWVDRDENNATYPQARRRLGEKIVVNGEKAEAGTPRRAAIGDGALVATLSFTISVPKSIVSVFGKTNAQSQLAAGAWLAAAAISLGSVLAAAPLATTFAGTFAALEAQTGVSAATIAASTSADAPRIYLPASSNYTVVVAAGGDGGGGGGGLATGAAAGIGIAVGLFFCASMALAMRRCPSMYASRQRGGAIKTPVHDEDYHIATFSSTNPLVLERARTAREMREHEAATRLGTSRIFLEAAFSAAKTDDDIIAAAVSARATLAAQQAAGRVISSSGGRGGMGKFENGRWVVGGRGGVGFTRGSTKVVY